jgi:Na+-driven multidrug efflux pump
MFFGELLAPRVVAFFPDAEAKVRELATRILRFQCATFFVNCWVVPSNMSQQTMGWTLSASTLAMARQGLFFIPAVLILPRLFGLFGLQISQSVADVITFAISIPLQISIFREMDAEMRARSAGG